MLTCNDCGYRWHPRCILGQHAARKVALPWYCQYCTRNHLEPAIDDSSLAPGTPVSNAGIDANVGSSARKHPKKKKKVESIDPPALNAMDEFDAATFVCSPERELGIVSTDLALEMKGQNYIEIAQQEEAASESYDGFVISVDNVCNIIAQLPDKILSRKELAIISAFRVWATLTELRKVFALLIDKNGGHGRAASIALTGSEAKSDYSAPIIDSGSLQSDIDEGVAFETVHNMCFLDSTAITSPGLICVSDHMLLDDDLPAFPEYGDLDEL